MAAHTYYGLYMGVPPRYITLLLSELGGRTYKKFHPCLLSFEIDARY